MEVEACGFSTGRVERVDEQNKTRWLITLQILLQMDLEDEITQNVWETWWEFYERTEFLYSLKRWDAYEVLVKSYVFA